MPTRLREALEVRQRLQSMGLHAASSADKRRLRAASNEFVRNGIAGEVAVRLGDATVTVVFKSVGSSPSGLNVVISS